MKIDKASIGASALLFLLLQPLASHAQFLPPWLAPVLQRRAQMLENVDLYIKREDVNIPGLRMALPDGAVGPCAGSICQAVIVEETDIPGLVIERPLSPMELAVMAGNTSSAFLDMLGLGLVAGQIGLNRALGMGDMDSMSAMADAESSDMAYMNPTTMFAAAGRMMIEAAGAARQAEESVRTSGAQAQSEADLWVDILPLFESAGTESVGTTPTEVYRTENLGGSVPPTQIDGGEWAFSSASLFIDPATQTMVKHRFEGMATMEGQSREFFIEVEHSDYRNPPGCGDLIEPFRRTVRMGGMLDEAQMAEMEQARAQLAEFEAQLAEMPAQQRQMVENMMGSQMQALTSLVDTGAFEYVQETEEILCNPELSTLFSIEGLEQEPDQELIRQIQEYLVILGYEPGNIDGVLDELTQIAISQFQAERGLPVTGQPTLQLAALLADAVTG
jgi:hypothetical protein